MELTSFTAAHRLPCFGSVATAALTTQQCFGYCWAVLAQCQGHLCFPLHPHSQAEGGQEAGTGHSWDSWLKSDQRDISCDVSSSTEIKTGIEEEKDFFLFSSKFFGCCLETGWVSVCHDLVHHLPCFASPKPTFSSSLIKLFIILTQDCVDFVLPIFSSISLWRAAAASELGAVWVLGCCPGWTYHSESNWKPIPDWCTLFSDSDLELAQYSVSTKLYLSRYL